MFAGTLKTSLLGSDGRLFQILAAATGKAHSLNVESRVIGTASAEVDNERRR